MDQPSYKVLRTRVCLYVNRSQSEKQASSGCQPAQPSPIELDAHGQWAHDA